MMSEAPLAGRYELRSVLGSGGQAVVYAAYDQVLDRPVAVKVLQDGFARDARFRARFRWEGRAAAGIVHPNVVRVYETGTDGDVEFIAMELVDGRPLSEVIAAGGPLPIERAVAIAADVAAALQAAHDRGLAHRDVKPGNVIVAHDGRPKVVDFGIMGSIDHATITETLGLFGTAAYLSPEQALGRPVDGRTDIYSLGCVLYEMLTGRPPYVDGSPMAVASQHVHGRPAPPSGLRPDLPPALVTVVLRALEKDLADRYPTAGAMREALVAVAAGAATGAPSDAPTVIFRRSPGVRRRRAKILAPALAAIVIAGAVALAPWDAGEQAVGGTQGELGNGPPASAAPVSAGARQTTSDRDSSGHGAGAVAGHAQGGQGDGKAAKDGHGGKGGSGKGSGGKGGK